MDDNNLLLLTTTSVLAIAIVKEKEKKRKARKRRCWMSTIFKRRSEYSGSHLLCDLQTDGVFFNNFCRMSANDFETLINVIGPRVGRKNTTFRKCIPVKERLAITLRFLATGDSYISLSYLFKVSKQSISNIVPEVCDSLIEALKDQIKMPTTEEEWLNIAQKFDELWNFPNCIGAMDGKHIVLQAPFNSGSEYFNYKSTFSIVLLAAVDANYCFTFCDIGCQGRISDGGVFRNSILFKKMERKELNLPADIPLPERKLPMPFVFVADDAFALSTNVMKPYPGKDLGRGAKRTFNYRLSRCRRISENSFGILSAAFRVLRKPMLLEPEKAVKVTMTCTYLHNFLRHSSSSRLIYTPQGTFDNEENGQLVSGAWRSNTERTSLLNIPSIARKSSIKCQAIRDEFADYFMTNGRVPWQENYE